MTLSLEPNLQEKYRPKSLSDMAGQETAQRIVHGMFQSGKIPRYILITGERGQGKSTLARIIARKLCPDGRDIFESNAAEDTGIEKMRGMIESARVKPMHNSVKVFVLDEIHGLTKNAGSAALSFLENPPDHVVVIGTTNLPQDMLPTLRERATHILLNPLDEKAILKILIRVSAGEQIFQPPAKYRTIYETIARTFNGSARPAMDALYQLSLIQASRPIKPEDIDAEIAKVTRHDYKNAIKFVQQWYSNNPKAMHILKEVPEADCNSFTTLLLNIHAYMLRKATGMNPAFDYMGVEASKGLKGVSVPLLQENFEILLDARSRMQWSQGRRLDHLLLNAILKMKGPQS